MSHVPRHRTILCENGQLVRITQSGVGRQISHAGEGGRPGGGVQVELVSS